MMYRAAVTVRLRPSILDPQGQAIQRALHDLGHGSVAGVRAGKHLELMIEAQNEQEAARIAREACAQLLANPVTEDFDVEVAPA
jgi:phosphoribosylformylglycinamidine synthase